jgi:hypothetical protein
MPPNNGSSGRANARPGPVASPNLFCLICCQLFKKGDQENIAPALTMVPINLGGLWVTVPMCIDHLESPRTSSIVTG